MSLLEAESTDAGIRVEAIHKDGASMNNAGIKVFAGSSGKPFAKENCDYLDIELGQSEAMTFSEGNTFVRINETVRGKDIYLVQSIGLNPNDEFVEILFWVDAFKRASANSVTVIMPYFSYAKGDKKDEPACHPRARLRRSHRACRSRSRREHGSAQPSNPGLFQKARGPSLCLARSLGSDPADESIRFRRRLAGCRVCQASEEIADYLGTSIAIGDKTRRHHNERAEILEIIGDVKGKTAVIIDDFSLTAGSIVELSKCLTERGAKRIIACLSHLLINEAAVKKIEASAIEMVIGTDSVDNPHVIRSPKIRIVSVAPLFGEAISQIHKQESVSPLFERVPTKVIASSTASLFSDD